MSRAPRRGAEPGDGPGCPARTGGRRSRGSVFLRLERIDELPILVALRAHWWQGSPRGPSQCPSSAGQALHPSGPGPSEERPPLRPLQPPASASAGRGSGPWVAVLLPGPPRSGRHQHPRLIAALPEEAPEAQQNPRHRLQGLGRRTRPHSCGRPLSQRPSSGWSENSHLSAWASSQATLQSWPGDTRERRHDYMCRQPSPARGPGQRARALVDPV